MKKTLSLVAAGLLGASLMVLTPSINADPMNASATGTMPAGHQLNKAKVKGMLGEKMQNKLNLTSEQVQKIKQIRENNRSQVMQYRQAMQQNRQQMRQLIRSKDFSSEKAAQLIKQQTDILQKLMLMRAEQAHQIWLILTPEQQAMWQQMKPTPRTGS